MSVYMEIDDAGEPPPSLEIATNSRLSSEDTEDSQQIEIADPDSDTTYVSDSELNPEDEELQTQEMDGAKVPETPTKKRRLSKHHEEDDSECCPICLDNWTTSGEHRLCSLNCGHLFGYNCVKRWLDSEVKKTCPTCKMKARTSDIRYLFARKIIAIDTTELTIIKDKMNLVIKERNQLQIDLSKSVCKIHSLSEEVEEYKRKLSAVSSSKQVPSTAYPSKASNSEIVNIFKEKTLDLGRNSNCRVLDAKALFDKIAISAKSTNNLYSGFGIKTVSLSNYRSLSFIPLHTQPIRDIKFHESQPWIVSCSVDKKAKILDLNTNLITCTFDCSSPLWSCCWGSENNFNLYLGQQNGSVEQYDIRRPSISLSTMDIPGDLSPVVSVQTIQSSSSPFRGVVSCKLNSIWLFDMTLDVRQSYPLPVEGPFISMSYQKDTEHLFLSSRPNARYPYVRHFLCGFCKDDEGVKCNIVHTLRGGQTQKMLSRSCLISNKNNYAAAYIEDQRIVCLWNINTGNKVATVIAREPVLDLNSVKIENDEFLLSLTETKLDLLKFTHS